MPTIDEFLQDAKRGMDRSIEMTRTVQRVRTGRASAALLDRITIDYYGTPTPLNNMATMGSPDPRLLIGRAVRPDPVKAIEKAIQASDLGLTPTNDGKFDPNVLPRLLLHGPDLLDVTNDPSRLPRHGFERRGQDDMRGGVREARVFDLARGRELSGERHCTLRVGVHRAPVLLIARIHAAAENQGVDPRHQIEGVLPRVDPVDLSVRALDEPVQRHPECSDELSHVNSSFEPVRAGSRRSRAAS